MDAAADAAANANADAGGSAIALRERCSGELMKGMISRRRLILFYIIQQGIPNICTKFQTPRCSSFCEIFDEKKTLHTHKHTNTQTHTVTEKTIPILYTPIYFVYRGYNYINPEGVVMLTIINETVVNIDSLFETCSKESFGSKTVKKDNKYSNLKPWFNRSCINARNIYHKTRKMYNQYKTDYHKNNLKIVSKNYKNTLSKNYKNFKIERIEKLRRLRTNDPKQYWKIVNAERKTGGKSAPLNDLYNFYKAASEHVVDDDGDDDDDGISGGTQKVYDNERYTMLSEELNATITSEEVLQVTETLKNNKSPGLDNVLNEQLKSTITVICEAL